MDVYKRFVIFRWNDKPSELVGKVWALRELLPDGMNWITSYFTFDECIAEMNRRLHANRT